MPDSKKNIISFEGETGRRIGELLFKRAYSGDRCILALEGELRHGNSEELYLEVLRLFQSGVTDLILDFRELAYCDTAGLQSLVRIFKYTQDSDTLKYVILVDENELYDILRTCRFDKFMDISLDASIIEGDWHSD